jgi:hypothetical protein
MGQHLSGALIFWRHRTNLLCMLALRLPGLTNQFSNTLLDKSAESTGFACSIK